MIIEGKCIKYGDNIDTDLIIAGKYTKTLDLKELAGHTFEDLDSSFTSRGTEYTVLVAGRNFGCGSSREQAVAALLFSGIKCVVAKSFARIFYRNAINAGLHLAECDTSSICTNDSVHIDTEACSVKDTTQALALEIKPMPEIMQEIIKYGGLVEYLKRCGDYPPTGGTK